MPAWVPLEYALRLVPDLTRFRFDGEEVIRLRADEAVEEVVLNAVDLAVWRCELASGGERAACRFEIDPARETLRVFFPRPAVGEFTLAIAYRGEINDRMAGFYRSRIPRGRGTRWLAVTQFQESDARRAFPCLDHPGVKARFRIEIDLPRGLTAVANTPLEERLPLAGGRQRLRFAPSPPMPTYLVFFAVGDLEIHPHPHDPRVRLVVPPGAAERGRFGLEFARRALAASEELFGVPYPLPKLDLIAVPDFAFGAMENWGAITFRENLLLHDPGVTSSAAEERICEVIAHEIAHQWFGNLVTPADWKYLWLNESFATYFGYGVVDRFYPDWETWEEFLQATTAVALHRDALHENVAIEIPGGEHLVINTSTAPIIYNKGASLLRQLEGWVGPASFRRGLRRYLESHAYGHAVSRDLWDALESVSNLPVTALLRNWVGQPGFPLVTVRREGDRLHLTQRRFTCLPGPSAQTWMIPLRLRAFTADGSSRAIELLFDTPARTLELEAGTVACKLNDGQSGYYRVYYEDRALFAALVRLARERRLPPADRWGLLEDHFAQVLAGAVSLEEHLALLSDFEAEDDPLPLGAVAAELVQAWLWSGERTARRVADGFARRFAAVLAAIGYEPKTGEPRGRTRLRERILYDAARLGCREAADFAAERFRQMRRGASLHPDLLRPVLQVAAWRGGAAELSWMLGRLRTSQSEHERMALLTALGGFAAPDLAGRVLDLLLTAVPERNLFLPVAALAARRDTGALLWAWYTGRRERIERLHPMIHERVLAAVIPAAGRERPEEVQAFGADFLRHRPRLADVVRLSLERLEIGLRLRRANP
ncbi:MAG: M1 family metallopeptidase [Desulfobacterales bacterium]